MSKMIRMTDEYRQQCVEEFAAAVKNAKMADGKISFTKAFNNIERKATVYFTYDAWLKMVMLISSFDKEVAWHGLAKRSEEPEKDEYIIYDILVYPQEVTGATVNTDQEKYQNWLMDFDDDKFFDIRMQGHSHVNMSTFPSSTDLEHQGKILNQLKDDMFYIFMIWNKSLQKNVKIYDLQKNVLFENNDIDVKIVGEIGTFIENAKKMVQPKTWSTTGTDTKPFNPREYTPNNPDASNSKQSNTPVNTGNNKKSGKTGKNGCNKPKAVIGAGWCGSQAYQDKDDCEGYVDEYDEYYESLYGGYGHYYGGAY